MNSKKFRLILLGILAFCGVLFIALCVFGLSILKGKSNQMVDLRLQNHTAEAQLTNLEISKKQVEKYSYFKEIANTVIPNDKDQAQAVLEIVELANQSGINIQSITFPTSTLGSTKSVSALPGDQKDAPAATSTRSSAISQAQPVPGIAGLYSLQLTITPETGDTVPLDRKVTYNKMIDFLQRIEKNRRTAQITQVNIQPVSSSSNEIGFSLSINIFIKP